MCDSLIGLEGKTDESDEEQEDRCYVLVERSARLELDGYDSVVWHVVLEASASDTR